MCYIDSSLDHGQIGYIGDNPVDLRLALYVDADFAGCRATVKSTTGVYLALVGSNSHFPKSIVPAPTLQWKRSL